MEVIPLVAGILDTNCYLIISEETRTALLIDAPPDSKDLVLEELSMRKLQLEAILLTHTHWDHTVDTAEIKKETGAKIFVSQADNYRLQEPSKHTLFPLEFDIEPAEADHLISGKELLDFRTAECWAIPTPGHTEGGLIYVFDSLRSAFVGDTIFYLSIGRSDLPGGDEESLIRSIRDKVFALPDDYILYPGHGAKTSVQFEKENNPFLYGI